MCISHGSHHTYARVTSHVTHGNESWVTSDMWMSHGSYHTNEQITTYTCMYIGDGSWPIYGYMYIDRWVVGCTIYVYRYGYTGRDLYIIPYDSPIYIHIYYIYMYVHRWRVVTYICYIYDSPIYIHISSWLITHVHTYTCTYNIYSQEREI